MIHSTSKTFYKDVLSIKFIVKNSSGVTLQDTKNVVQDKNHIQSIRFLPHLNSLVFSYQGTNCNIGNGLIYMKKLNSTQISWTFNPQTTAIDDASCPPSVDKHIYLPDTQDLIFTKQ